MTAAREAEPPRIMVLATYPVAHPSHGGQVRLRGLIEAAEAAGCIVDTISIYPDFQFPPEARGPSDVVITGSKEFADAYYADMLFGDIMIGAFVSERSMLLAAVSSAIATFSPDYLWLEQPFLYPVVERLPASIRSKMKIIYSSQNDELKLKRILGDLQRGPGIADVTFLDAVNKVEKACTAAASHLICINDEEAEELRRTGRSVSYLPATSRIDFNTPISSKFSQLKEQEGVSYLAYAASSYWLNVDGYFDCFDAGLGFLRPNEKVWLAGSCCETIYKDSRFEAHRSINESRAYFHGFLSDAHLTDFYASASAVLVPVTQGAGSNLKTADALASGRPVISTPKGLAGFRSMLGDALGNGVYEAADPLSFRKLCREAVRGQLRSPPPAISAQFREAAQFRRVEQALLSMGIIKRAPAPQALAPDEATVVGQKPALNPVPMRAAKSG